MIILRDIHLPVGFCEEDVIRAARKEGFDLRKGGFSFEKLSLDARKKPNLRYIASISFSMGSGDKGKKLLSKPGNSRASVFTPQGYSFPDCGTLELKHRPVIIGAGPGGLFCALTLAERGYAPIVLERGRSVARRSEDVRKYWDGGKLDPSSNVQFGEGGAGTFSDGKLHTQVKERSGRIRRVLEAFVACGASEEILYWNKPHIGTDVLKNVVTNLSSRIRKLGGEILFETKVSGIITSDGRLTGLTCETPEGKRVFETDAAVFAIGHSARDTFMMLDEAGVPMSAKDFAVGIRVQHHQDDIQLAQYGLIDYGRLPVADYKLAARAEDGRGVYSFCMCPGGQVVDASSEEGMIAVNGMSGSRRDGRNANSAIVVSVSGEDFAGSGPLAGMLFQRELERAAFMAGQGKIPVQLLGDFRDGRLSTGFGEVMPDICGGYSFGDLNTVLPVAVCKALRDGFGHFDHTIRGFGRADAILAGVESRTSSPVRIERDEHFESPLKGLFPCGEGAGYAGGITSAAVDGIKIAEEIIRRYRPYGSEGY